MAKLTKKEQLFDIKFLTQEIRETRSLLKDVERYLSKLQRDKFPYHDRLEKKKIEIPVIREMNKLRDTIEDKKTEFRINHIMNSLLRGRNIYQIESKIHDSSHWYPGNKSYDIYNEVQKRLKEKGWKWEIPHRGAEK